MTIKAFDLASIEVFVYRAAIETPVRTAFGTMSDRPAVIVRARNREGVEGWGEIWCNFPACGAEHRARLATSCLAPMIVDRPWSSPEAVFTHLMQRVRLLVLQTGEPGPFAQAIAGIDIALWDLIARQAGVPLWRFLGGVGDGFIPVYASGIDPDQAAAQAQAANKAGFRAFKLKVGFGWRQDLASLAVMRDVLDSDLPIALDANQAWSLDEALAMGQSLAPLEPLWLEEPMAADRPPDEWRRLSEATSIPLAAGENIRGERAFDEAINGGFLRVLQPDVAKWGGISGCLPVAKRATSHGVCYCPHYLGGGIGLMASAHLLAAVGGDGLLEIDCNLNPLREGLARPFPSIKEGGLVLPETPGLGVAPGPSVTRYLQSMPD